MNSSSTKEEVQQIHADALARTNELIENLRASNAQNEESIRKEVELLISSIESDNGRLKNLVEELESDSEFEKFTIAFFGQTNAGKSTIIEALRILFKEDLREETIAENRESHQKWREKHVEQCRKALTKLEELKKLYTPHRQWKHWTFWLLVAFVAGLITGLIVAL